MPREPAARESTQETAVARDFTAMQQAPEQGPLADAAALAVQRDLPTPGQQWEQSLGKLLGGKLHELVKRHASAEDFMRLGRSALEGAVSRLGTTLQAEMVKGSVDERLTAKRVSDALLSELRPLAAAFMTHGAGADLAQMLAETLEGNPLATVGAMILAAAAAIVSDMPIPEIQTAFGLGNGFAVRLSGRLGTLRHAMVESLNAQLHYETSGIRAMVGYERLAGRHAEKALSSISPRYIGGGIEDHATVDRLSADLAFQIGALDKGNAHLSYEGYLRNGQLLRGTVGAQLGFNASPDVRVQASAKAEQNAGAAMSGTAALNLSYQPNKHESYAVGVTQGFGSNNAGTGVNFRMQLDERMEFEGRYDRQNGAYVGVVFRLPL